MKGKKFNAHEKHFKEKEIKLSKERNRIIEIGKEINNQNVVLSKENEILKKEKLDITLKYEKLLEYSELTDTEVKEALKRDKSMNEFSSMLKVVTKFM